VRRRAEVRACRESARDEAALLPSRLALRRVFSDVVPFLGGGSFTPALRAFDSPIAIACLVERAPCLPRRM
jgi:hypothetical protein